jgi:hypothetical protein
MAIQQIHPPQIEKSLPALACPVCHGKLLLQDKKILCTSCTRAYPIIDGIPVLIAERGTAI